jgi:hypothetical protein
MLFFNIKSGLFIIRLFFNIYTPIFLWPPICQRGGGGLMPYAPPMMIEEDMPGGSRGRDRGLEVGLDGVDGE